MKNEDLGIINDENFARLRSERNRLLAELLAVETTMKRDYQQLLKCPDEYKGYFKNRETPTQHAARCKNTAENLEWVRPKTENERYFSTSQVKQFPSDEALSELGLPNDFLQPIEQ